MPSVPRIQARDVLLGDNVPGCFDDGFTGGTILSNDVCCYRQHPCYEMACPSRRVEMSRGMNLTGIMPSHSSLSFLAKYGTFLQQHSFLSPYTLSWVSSVLDQWSSNGLVMV
jgi:hypothetical protein